LYSQTAARCVVGNSLFEENRHLRDVIQLVNNEAVYRDELDGNENEQVNINGDDHENNDADSVLFVNERDPGQMN
jgi:hypothetical protein